MQHLHSGGRVCRVAVRQGLRLVGGLVDLARATLHALFIFHVLDEAAATTERTIVVFLGACLAFRAAYANSLLKLAVARH